MKTPVSQGVLNETAAEGQSRGRQLRSGKALNEPEENSPLSSEQGCWFFFTPRPPPPLLTL